MVDRDVEETLNLRMHADPWSGCGRHRRSTTGRPPASQVIEHPRLVLLVLAGIPVVRNHGRYPRAALERLKVSSMMRSSIRFSLAGWQIGCTTNTSVPRTFSST